MRFLKWNIKNLNFKLPTFSLGKTLNNQRKDKLMGEKSLRTTDPTKDFYPEYIYIKKKLNSTVRKQITQLQNVLR